MKSRYISPLATLVLAASAQAEEPTLVPEELSVSLYGMNGSASVKVNLDATDASGRDVASANLFADGHYRVRLINPDASYLEATLQLYDARGAPSGVSVFSPSLDIDDPFAIYHDFSIPYAEDVVAYSLLLRSYGGDADFALALIDEDIIQGDILGSPSPIKEDEPQKEVAPRRLVADHDHFFLGGAQAGFSLEGSVQHGALGTGFVSPVIGYIGEHGRVDIGVLGWYSFNRTHPEDLESTGAGLRFLGIGHDADLDIRTEVGFVRQQNALHYPVWVFSGATTCQGQFAVPVGVHTTGRFNLFAGEDQGASLTASLGPVVALPGRTEWLRFFADAQVTYDPLLAEQPQWSVRSGASIRPRDIHFDIGFVAGQQNGGFVRIVTTPIEQLEILGDVCFLYSPLQTDFSGGITVLAKVPLLKSDK